LVFSLAAKETEVETEDTERSVFCMKRAKHRPDQKLKFCSRLRGIAFEFTSRTVLKGEAVAVSLAIILSA